MRWFGDDWGGEVCKAVMHAETPVGTLCMGCEDAVLPDDRGLLLPRPAPGVFGPDGEFLAVVFGEPALHVAYHVDCIHLAVAGPDGGVPARREGE